MSEYQPPKRKADLRRDLINYRNMLLHASDRADKWAKRYDAEHKRIVDLALEHSPKLDAEHEDHLPGFGKTISLFDDKQPEFTCNGKHCHYFWPCPTYLWATGSEPFNLVIERKEVQS